ncbi:hypothetical protein BACCAP_02632 [Pseudoflavonifractor capillosus ATCC 29799]|uniref:Uncharacterized protein n=1 Tax=Pseudoflavonifractor capillosus ATCC 29799 TaxID=411467 RepID=A6NWN7_9FIRM|nr:hypothetical protein BACCAP_02632 [Pseudoflavonifractor capillosus ATCC 29799]
MTFLLVGQPFYGLPRHSSMRKPYADDIIIYYLGGTKKCRRKMTP